MDQDPMVVAPADGVVRGDDKAMPNRGTGVGFVGMGAPYGADVSQGATNARGSAHLSSDPADQCYPPGGGDYRSGGDGTPSNPGTSMGSAADSDPPGEDTPDNPNGLKATPDADSAEDEAEYEGK